MHIKDHNTGLQFRQSLQKRYAGFMGGNIVARAVEQD
jgi:hypothetical protein